MNRIKICVVTVLTVMFCNTGNAQFSLDFDATSFTPYTGGNPYTTNSGCFLNLNGSSYDPVLDALDWNGTSNKPGFITPVLDLESNTVVELDVTLKKSGSLIMVGLVSPNGGVALWDNAVFQLNPNGQNDTMLTLTYTNLGYSGLGRLYIWNNTYDRVAYHGVKITNATYTPPTSGCSVSTVVACPDADSDGVCDNVDDFPNDGDKAYSSIAPWMTWMYEDLFPAYGDFDFNDMVVSAEREVITDADNDVRFVKVKAAVDAAGAGMAQGWALELTGINPADVVGVVGNNVTDNVMSLGGNGTENGQTHAVIPVFDNFNNVINRAGGAFFNTVAGSPTGICDTVTLMIELKKSSAVQIGDLNYNFFSFRTDDRSHEIHEMGNTPTDLANMTLFGTKMDASDLNNGESYVSVDGLPWAISSAGSAYPNEKTDIVEAFLKMATWAQSGGSLFQDWHTNPTEGTYRNSTKIY